MHDNVYEMQSDFEAMVEQRFNKMIEETMQVSEISN